MPPAENHAGKQKPRNMLVVCTGNCLVVGPEVHVEQLNSLVAMYCHVTYACHDHEITRHHTPYKI